MAYVGALGALDDKGILDNITRVSGTSAGAITAVLAALNYSNKEIETILRKLDFRSFMDQSWFLINMARLAREFGWYKGDFFETWIGDIIEAKTGKRGATFSDIAAQSKEKGFRELYIVGTNLSTHYAEVFSHEKTPDMPIAEAVRISMSIPLFFASKKNKRGDTYVDGGMLANYPIKLFDRAKYVTKNARSTDYYDKHNRNLARSNIRISPYVYNKETLGFRLDAKEEIGIFRDHKEPVHHLITNFITYTQGLVRTLIDQQLNQHLHGDDWQRTIYIDASAAKTTEFDLTDEKKQALIEAGRAGVEKYFEWFDGAACVNK